jgi:TPR repeat protein
LVLWLEEAAGRRPSDGIGKLGRGMYRLLTLLILVNRVAFADALDDARTAIQERRFEQARSLLKEPAAEGAAEAQVLLGALLRDGEGGKADAKAAFKLYQAAASTGSVEAQLQLGLLYRRGFGVAVSHRLAIEQFDQAAKSGSTDAKFWRARIHHESEVVRGKKAAAAVTLLKMAKDGHPLAVVFAAGAEVGTRKELAAVLEHGGDFTCHVALTTHGPKLAAAGDAEAQFQLGFYLYLFRNEFDAAEGWLEKAATQSHAEAQFRLGKLLLYWHTMGGHKTHGARLWKGAKKWLQAAALQGIAEAAYELSGLLRDTGADESEVLAALFLWRDIRKNLGPPLTKEERKKVTNATKNYRKHVGAAKQLFGQWQKTTLAGVKRQKREKTARTGKSR